MYIRINFAEIRTISKNWLIYHRKNELTGKQDIEKD